MVQLHGPQLGKEAGMGLRTEGKRPEVAESVKCLSLKYKYMSLNSNAHVKTAFSRGRRIPGACAKLG